MLDKYVEEVRNLLNDQEGQFFRLPTLHNYINRTRRRIAAMSGCLRAMPPGTLTVPRQEQYPFRNWLPLIQGMTTGTESILACRSLAVSIGGRWERGQVVGGAWKPLWRRLPFTDFQARFRITSQTFFGTFAEPGYWSQYGEGPLGILYLFPIPAQAVPMEVDLSLIPTPLLTDADIEPIPYPWVDAVSYFASVLCLLQQQRREDAEAMANLFNAMMPECASVVCPQMIQTAYGATIRSA